MSKYNNIYELKTAGAQLSQEWDEHNEAVEQFIDDAIDDLLLVLCPEHLIEHIRQRADATSHGMAQAAE